MIVGIASLILAVIFGIACVYLDYKWIKRILDLFEDQGVARDICDSMLERDEPSRGLTWKEVGKRPKSDYYWRLKYVSICADGYMAQIELACLGFAMLVQVLIALCIASPALMAL
jgi:hypothetical protein